MADHGHEAHAHAAHGEEHGHGGAGIYVLITVALCVLTLGSFLTYFDFWRDKVDIVSSRMMMMAIAVSKASLVMLFFMHLKWEAAWKYVLTIPSMIMAVFLMVALIPDVGLRENRYSEERTARAAAPAVYGQTAHDTNHDPKKPQLPSSKKGDK